MSIPSATLGNAYFTWWASAQVLFMASFMLLLAKVEVTSDKVIIFIAEIFSSSSWFSVSVTAIIVFKCRQRGVVAPSSDNLRHCLNDTASVFDDSLSMYNSSSRWMNGLQVYKQLQLVPLFCRQMALVMVVHVYCQLKYELKLWPHSISKL